MGVFGNAVRQGITQEFIAWANAYWAGRDNDRKRKTITTSQIRNVFGSVKRMEMSTDGDVDLPGLLLLQPRLRYAAARAESRPGDFAEFVTHIEDAINAVAEAKDKNEQRDRFRRFCQGFEAILAYHRAHGGK